MADYRNSKDAVGGVFPVGSGDSTWKRVEPLITPTELIDLHLFGIPLVSGMPDPETGRRKRLTPEIIARFIDKSVGLAELETGLAIFPEQFKEKKPWDRQEYDSFGYFKLDHRPCSSVEKVAVNLSNNQDIYEAPLDWVETGQLQWGQLNIIPLTIAMTSGNPVAIPTTSGGALLLSIFQGKSQWVASFWEITYTAGFPDGQVPRVVNELIGTIAAMEILSQLASTYAKTSGSSLSIDGLSQSVSTPGPDIFTPRLKDLALKRTQLVNKLKNLYHLKFFSNNV
jgi:hypothetical protein